MFDKRKDPPATEAPPPREPMADNPTPSSFTSRSAAVIGQTIKIKGTITGDENRVRIAIRRRADLFCDLGERDTFGM